MTDRRLEDFGPNVGLVEEIYRQWLENPASVSESWRDFFEDYTPRMPDHGNGGAAPAPAAAPPAPAKEAPPAAAAAPKPAPPSGAGAQATPIRRPPPKIADLMATSRGV